MRITLVQPPSNHEETFLLSPPLGLLSIAAVAEGEGAEVTLLDFNLKGLQDQRWQTAEYFYPHALELIRKTKPDIVGFTSMTIESHVGLQLAQELKEEHPEIITLLGGPHFGAIATEVLEHYSWIDYVIAGEGEVPLQHLLRLLQENGEVTDLSNIARRTDAGITFERKSLAGRDLDEIPFPAYHLVDMEEYFTLNPSRLVCFEHARGCYLKCSFCYSPQHWGHGESRKPIPRLLAELEHLQKMGVKELFWVSDNLLNSKEHAITVSEAIDQSGMHFKWHCYGTMPQITEPVLKALAKAGCRSIFVGVDAVSEDTKKNYKKSYFKGWDALRAKLRMCIENNVRPTCAFMLSPHDRVETRETTLRIAALCANLGCFVRLNALTYYNKTEIERNALDQFQPVYSEAYSTVLFDTAQILNSNELAEIQPKHFPFHRTYTEKSQHDYFAGYCRLAMHVVNQHAVSNVRLIFDFDARLGDLVWILRRYFDLNELSCQEISSQSFGNKYYNVVANLYKKIGLDDSLLIYDFQRFYPSPEDAHSEVNLRVEDNELICSIKDIHCIETSYDFDRLQDEEKADKGSTRYYLSHYEGKEYSNILVSEQEFREAKTAFRDTSTTDISTSLFCKLVTNEFLSLSNIQQQHRI